MNLENFLMPLEIQQPLCKDIFKVLTCNLLWVMKLDNKKLSMFITDKFILEHYWRKKYYLQDPNLLPIPTLLKNNQHKSIEKEARENNEKKEPGWTISLGTECELFKNSGFLYDLYKLFEIQEFVSIEKKTASQVYCFRFFTRNNRYVFMNKLINNMPIIKYFIEMMVEKFKVLDTQPTISMRTLK